jgi:hypothetical protein
MNPVGPKIRGSQLFRSALTLLALSLFCSEVVARVGGGQSYGGGGSGGGDGDDGLFAWLIFELLRLLIYLTIEYPAIGIPLDIIVIAGVVYFLFRRRRSTVGSFTSAVAISHPPSSVEDIEREFDQLRRFDPNFSEIVFTDFCYALYAKAHHARAGGNTALDLLSPYLSQKARDVLMQRNPNGLSEVKGIIIGSMHISNVHGLETTIVRISLMFETNYTEVVSGSENTYYIHERWDLERKRDVLSPPPEKATALHCPRCGAALERDTVGACKFCGTKIDSGEFQWYVRSITLLSRETKGPLLSSDVPEVGTDFPSIMQPGLLHLREQFEKNNPGFSWVAFQNRAALIFNELQAAWSTLNWERARPHETDSIFQMHQFWIDAYRRQRLRNILDQYAIRAMQPVKIKEDAFYQAITVRIWASGYDYTVDEEGKIVSGSNQKIRQWSEYWTFIRNRNAKPGAAHTDLNCPNCAAPLKVNAAGVCEFCGGKITSGEFDWVLSKIEQDESYRG